MPGEHLASQPPPDPRTARGGGNPESRYRPLVTGEPFDQREPHRRVLAGNGMRPPGQVPHSVRRGKSSQLSRLVPAVGVREPVDDGGQVMPERLPQPGHDHPLVTRNGANARQTTGAGLAGTVRTSVAHPGDATASGGTRRRSRRFAVVARSQALGRGRAARRLSGREQQSADGVAANAPPAHAQVASRRRRGRGRPSVARRAGSPERRPLNLPGFARWIVGLPG